MIKDLSQPVVVGVDTGGTFTDFVFVGPHGDLWVDKLPSNPADPALPVIKGLSDYTGQYRVTHGTTVATNALLEGKTAACALITTAGFEDVLEIGRQARPILYELSPRKPAALIPSNLRFGVKERVSHTGQVLTRLDTEEVSALLTRIRGLGIESLAVCLLHSYAYSGHEEKIREMALEQGFRVSISSRVIREFREYERASTVALNASLRPVVEDYLGRLDRDLAPARLGVMASAGGTLPPAMAGRLPIHTILSGPAGGVIAATRLARMTGLEKIITFDMGGTSTDVSLCDRGPTLASERLVAGHPVRLPHIDIHTVGAGGGSIATRDAGGALKVGPLSAGADPGPVCYGKGNAVTVTDANLFLGRMEPAAFLGGRMKVDAGRIPGPMNELARSLGLDPVETAQGIITVVNSVMERAVRVISIQRGHDPREFTLVSFGGAGGLHAVELARSLGAPRALIPVNSGVFSALGMAMAPVSALYSRTIRQRADAGAAEEAMRGAQALIEEGTAELAEQGIDPDRLRASVTLDMRYVGQSHELSIPFSQDPAAAFHDAHEAMYGFRRAESPVETVTVRVQLIAEGPDAQAPQWRPKSGPKSPERRTKPVIFGTKEVSALLVDRDTLPGGAKVAGPALVLESTATTFLPPGCLAEVDDFGNLVIEV